MKRILYCLQAMILYPVFYGLRALPLDSASNLGGWIGRTCGPMLGASKKAMKNLALALPDKTEAEHLQIMKDMWEHLGRIFAEYPHIKEIAATRTTIKDVHRVRGYKQDDKGAMYISGHIGNWEIGCAACYLQEGVKIGSAYRPLNNPWADRLLVKARTLDGTLSSFSKSRSGGRAMMRAAKNNDNIVFMIDQKYREGIVASFFGHDAMTNIGFLDIAQKYGLDVIPVRMVREPYDKDKGVRFTLYVFEKLKIFDADDTRLDASIVLNTMHAMMEDWIREHPEQWLWLHRRWG